MELISLYKTISFSNVAKTGSALGFPPTYQKSALLPDSSPSVFL
jgi:hypothetical protein